MTGIVALGDYEKKYGFHDPESFSYKVKKGLSESVVREISKVKGEPDWMLQLRLKALSIFFAKPMPSWGGDLSRIDFYKFTYFLNPAEKTAHSWDEVPTDIKKTFDRLGIPEAEQKFLGGVGAQYESQTVYHKLREDLAKQGVIFTDTDTALKEHPEIFKKFFATIVPPGDNKFAALNTAVWSGGSFIYIPPGVKVTVPLQAYFRINAKNIGQFERTLIIADKDSEVSYI
ncbi:MAG TPA: Fe-S cluster assembly protein SufB, partial [Candidatus Nanoarchaeia archaeon]|nr:Fe-S cluster assembly protein SufB [Candidatus Nanoarchaeia archaeon]